VDDRADRRFDRERETIDERMRSVDESDFEISDLDDIVRLNSM
jgi:hypothetical protein